MATIPASQLPLSSLKVPATPEEQQAQRAELADGLIELIQQAEGVLRDLERQPGTTLEERQQLQAVLRDGLAAQSLLATWAQAAPA